MNQWVLRVMRQNLGWKPEGGFTWLVELDKGSESSVTGCIWSELRKSASAPGLGWDSLPSWKFGSASSILDCTLALSISSSTVILLRKRGKFTNHTNIFFQQKMLFLGSNIILHTRIKYFFCKFLSYKMFYIYWKNLI